MRHFAGIFGDFLIGKIVQDLPSQLNVIVSKLANLSVVDTQDLGLLGSAKLQTRDQVEQEENEAGSAKRVDASGHGISELVAELHPVVVDPAAGDLREAVQMSYVICGEEGSQDVADETTDGVLGEDIKSVVDAEHELELGGVVGTCCSDDSVDDCSPGGNESGPGSDGNETGDDARTEADGRPLALKTIIEETPGDASDAGGEVGDYCGHDCAHVGSESGTSIESKPTNPEEDGADDDVCDVVGTIIKLVSLCYIVSLILNWERGQTYTVTAALAQHDGVSQSSTPRGNMHWGSSSEIETSHLGNPARRVPCPASNWIVDDG
jgi:hypothetical protein